MKYDSRKTLNENKKMLFEDCIPKDTVLNDAVVGNTRSDKYPELGKWGDGNCLCSEKKCLRYDKSCCKQSKVEVGQVEYKGKVPEGTVEINGVDYKGDPITLPAGTKVGVKYTNFEYGEYKVNYDAAVKRFPKMVTYCQLAQQSSDRMEWEKDTPEYQVPNVYKKKDLKTCVLDAVNNLLKDIPNNAIMTFNYDGLWYNACYSKTKEIPDLEFKWTGYFGATNEERSSTEKDTCVGKPWDPSKLPTETDPNTGKTLTGTETDVVKKETEYGTGNEVLLPLIK